MPVPLIPLPAVPMSPAQQAHFNQLWAKRLADVDQAFEAQYQRRMAEIAKAKLETSVPLAHPDAPRRVRARL